MIDRATPTTNIYCPKRPCRLIVSYTDGIEIRRQLQNNSLQQVCCYPTPLVRRFFEGRATATRDYYRQSVDDALCPAYSRSGAPFSSVGPTYPCIPQKILAPAVAESTIPTDRASELIFMFYRPSMHSPK
jgi:hypothetical protein